MKIQVLRHGASLCSRDHPLADIDPGPLCNDVCEVKKSLPGIAAEIEHTRFSHPATARAQQIAEAGGEFERSRRKRPMHGVPNWGEGIKFPCRC